MRNGLFLALLALPRLVGQGLSESDRAYLIDHLAMTREFVLDTTRNLTREQWLFKPAPNQWSIAECVDHIAATEEYLLKLVKERVITSDKPLLAAYPSIAKGRQAEQEQPRRMSLVEDAYLIRAMTDRVSSMATPVEHRPPIQEIAPRIVIDNPQAVLENFVRVRTATITYLRETKDDLRGHFIQTSLIGFPQVKYHDAYQWLLRSSAHTERHLMQIQGVRQHDAYPRPKAATSK
jgi:hypothetical protein